MRVIYASKGMSKKFGVRVIYQVRVIYRKIRYIGRACGMYGGQESSTQGFNRETWWKETKDLGLNGEIILKWINKWDAAA
jgi:hypothetical protein